MDLGLDLRLSVSLYISFLRISATCCVSWANRLFGKASPMNGFDVSLPATVLAGLGSLFMPNELGSSEFMNCYRGLGSILMSSG